MFQIKGLQSCGQSVRHLSGGFCRHTALTFPPLCIVSVLLGVTVFPAIALRAKATPPSFKPKTMEAFSAYVRATDARNNSELQSGKDFLWIDALTEAARNRAYKSLAAGEPQIEQRNTLADGREIRCP